MTACCPPHLVFSLMHYRSCDWHLKARERCKQFGLVLVQGNMLAERRAKGKKKETALLGPGSMLDAAAYLSSTRSRASMRAATSCRLAAFGAQELEALLVSLLLLWGSTFACMVRELRAYF